MRRATQRASQHGYALIAAIALVGLVVSAVLITSLSSAAIKSAQDRKTAEALAQAKDALLGYAVGYIKTGPPKSFIPGWLPCPDTDTSDEGSADCGTKTIGRLPWKTLGLSNLRDGANECLWYAISDNFKNDGSMPTPFNSTTTGTITIEDGNGITVANDVVAVVFAPGTILPGQDRTTASATLSCGGNLTPANYLDHFKKSPIDIDNSTGNGSNLFVIANTTNAFSNQTTNLFNDQLTYITAAQLFTAVDKRVLLEIRNILNQYYSAHGNKYPWAASTIDGDMQNENLSGFFPYNNTDVSNIAAADTPSSAWLNDQQWLPMISYQVNSDQTQAILTLTDVTNLPTPHTITICVGASCS